MPTAFQDRVLAERTRALARRGVSAEAALLPPSLVCIAGGCHHALPMASVASIRGFNCQPIPLLRPRAAPMVLGLALFGHRLVSVLDLGGLLGLQDAAPTPTPSTATGTGTGTAGSMILLRGTEMPVAVRVQSVLGVLRLLPSAEPGRALLPITDASDPLPALVRLLDSDTLLGAIAALDHA